jgi:TolA-binding protein
MLRLQLPDFGQLPANAGKRLSQQRELLTALGKLLLARVQGAYDTKADHGKGSDGITWPDVSRRTLESRVLRRGPARLLREQINGLQEQLRRLSHSKNQTAQQAQIRRTIEQAQQRIKALIEQEVANHQIGIDTGLQRAAKASNLDDNVWNRPDEDGRGQNVFAVTDTSVTVGYQRTYSHYFDAARKLIPETIPDAWMSDLDREAGRQCGRVIRDAIDAMKGS